MSHVLPDYLALHLRAVFCGTAVGNVSRDRGGYYAGPGNEFWSYLWRAGLTPVLLMPETDRRVLEFGLGLTDLVKDRSASSDRALVGYDVPGFIRKVERYEPQWVAFHGKTAAKEVARSLRASSDLSLGPQVWAIGSSRVYVLPSASGSNRDPSRLEGKPSRLAWFKDLARRLDADERAMSRG